MQLRRSGATVAIKQLEERLGTRLPQRSTRHVSPTEEGETYYSRCVAVLADVEEAGRCFTDRALSGTLRVGVDGYVAREFILPELSAFLELHSALTVHVGEGDSLVKLAREGVDCVVRAGEPVENDMIGRRLGVAHEITCASPDYLRKHGVPASPDELDGNLMMGVVSSRTGRVMPLEFVDNAKVKEVTRLSRIQVNNADTAVSAARLGYGLTQAPRRRFLHDLSAGTLIEIVAETPPKPTPIFLLYQGSRQLSPRVRVFIDWLVDVLGPTLQPM